MNLKMNIHNVKCIKDLEFTFPLESGIYAITGENGSGKSTLISCASTVFYQMSMNDYFGRPADASIEFYMDGATRNWTCNGSKWTASSSRERMKLNGFYEGSIIFGNRFKDTKFSVIRLLDSLKLGQEEIFPASEFVRENLGRILHNDAAHFQKLYILNRNTAKEHGLSGAPYFYETLKGDLISQARMSTGENLLISILHSIEILRNKRLNNTDGRPCIVFLDEIELALHASALRRLVIFLKEVSAELSLAIFFSTHSIELLREIKPQNIYYLSYNVDDSISVTNPCYPAYATRNLYSDDGYGNDMVILVEDDLAKIMIEKLLIEKALAKNVRIKVLPTGGWTNVLIMAYDIIASNLLMKGTRLAIILDRDIKGSVPNFLKSHKECRNLNVDYLPIESLEKYLRKNLYLSVNRELHDILNTYVFQKKPLDVILREYKQKNEKEDSDGKILYGYLYNELRSLRKDREDLIELVVKFILEYEQDNVEELTSYLSNKLSK